MRHQYNPENLDAWLRYYADQANQTGYGLEGFRGSPYQRGGGLGSFFRSLFRMAVPVFKSAASHVGKQALSSGANLATDLANGRHFVEALEDHAKQGAAELLNKANSALQKGKGLGTRPKCIKGDVGDIFDKKTRKNVACR